MSRKRRCAYSFQEGGVPMDEHAFEVLCMYVGSDRFAWWVSQYSSLADRVAIAIITLSQVQKSDRAERLQAGRDAANTLHMIAREGGFVHEAAVFSKLYDSLCCALLPYWFEVV